MERLTDEDGVCVDCQCISYCKRDCSSKKRYDKLKVYEDLGFTPEDIAYMAKFSKEHTSTEAIINNMKTCAKVMEWAKYKNLEEQERILILPCKIGTPVYTITFYNCLNGKCCWYKQGKCTKEKANEYCPQEVIEQKYSLTMYINGDKVYLTREEAEANVGVLRVKTEVI